MDISDRNSRGESVFIVTTTTFVLASLFVTARLVSRFAILRHRTWDDWFMVLAWIIAFGLSFAIDYGTSKGLGKHDYDIPSEWVPALRRSEYAFTILYNPTLMATKTSILIFYLRMSRNTQKALRIASYVTLAVVNLAGVVLTFLNGFQCSPPSAAYDPTKSNDRCMSIVTLYLCSAPVNIITDLAILVLPIPVLTGMHLPQRQKTILVLTFALGIFVTIVDVVRIYYLQQAVDNQAVEHASLGSGLDFAFNASTALMWSAVEVNVGIICACIPTLKPLVKRILPTILKDLSSSGTTTDKDASFSSQVPEENSRVQVQAHRPSHVEQSAPVIQPLPASQTGGDPDQEQSMMDFLTTPGMDHAAINTARTNHTSTTDHTIYFGFVNMQKPKSMLKTKGMESFKYCAIVTTLFFLWGFSYGLLNTLNSEIAKLAHESTSQTLGLSSAYFGAYFFGSLTVGQFVLRHSGFKATFISGLCIYGTGTLMFWPSAVLSSFPGFIISTFVVGFGLSVLETAANPFLALCGPSANAEYRLLMAQGVQAVASVLSQLLAEKVLFSSVLAHPTLIDVQWTYLAIALFTVFLALFFYYMPLPEAADVDLQEQAENLGIYKSQTIFSPKLPLIYVSLALAVFAQFCYVSAQEAMSDFFELLLSTLAPEGGLTLTTSNYVLVGHTLFAISRFLFGGLCLIFPPRILLLVSFFLGLVFAILTCVLSLAANGIAGPALMFFFFEGPVFPMVYATGLRGLGRRTKQAASYLTAACAGGGGFPFVLYAVQKADNRSVQVSYVVIAVLFLCGLVFPVFLNVIGPARRMVDPIRGDPQILPLDRPALTNRVDQDHKRKFSAAFNFRKRNAKLGLSPELGFVEHRERGSAASGAS